MMHRHCSEIGRQKQPEDAEHIGEPIAHLLDEVIAMSREIEEKTAQIKECPKPCDDGTVKINTSSGGTNKISCPVITPDCPFGERMEQELDYYLLRVMAIIGIPRLHLERIRKTKKTKAFMEPADWLKRRFLIFTGVSGSGKSFNAALAVFRYLKDLVKNHFDLKAWEVAERAGHSIVWRDALDIIHDRKTAIQAKHESLTIIDDLGGEADTPTAQGILRSIILFRYDMELPTVITTTLTLLDINLRYGERVTRRLTEDIGKGCRIIDCGKVSAHFRKEGDIR